MTARECLPSRRGSEVVEFSLGGVLYTATISRFADGRIGEVFLDGPKIGSAAQIAGREAAVLASLALQHGVEAAALLHSLEKLENGHAAGPIGHAIELFEARA